MQEVRQWRTASPKNAKIEKRNRKYLRQPSDAHMSAGEGQGAREMGLTLSLSLARSLSLSLQTGGYFTDSVKHTEKGPHIKKKINTQPQVYRNTESKDLLNNK